MIDQRLAPSSELDSIEIDCLSPRALEAEASRVGHHGVQMAPSTVGVVVRFLNRGRAARSARGRASSAGFQSADRDKPRDHFSTSLGAWARETTRHLAAVAMLSMCATGAGAIDAGKFLQLDGDLLVCFDQQAARLDDGRSDARSVATAVYAACGAAKMKVLGEMGFSSQDAIAKAYKDARDQDIDRATIAVLKVRGAKR